MDLLRGGGGYGCCGVNLRISFCCQGNTLVLEVWAVSLDLRYRTRSTFSRGSAIKHSDCHDVINVCNRVVIFCHI